MSTAEGSPRSRVRTWPRRAGWHAVLVGAALAMLFPLFWAASASFKPKADVYDASPLPIPATLANYTYTLDSVPIFRMMLNTLVTAGGVTLLQILVAVPAAYAFVRFRHRGQGVAMALVTVALVVPPQALVIPLFLMVSELGWRNTFVGLILPQLGTCSLAVLLLRQQIQAIPLTLLGAATLDGATHGETLRRVVLPLLRPTLAAVGIIVFITTWNEYLWPALVAPKPEHTTIQLGLALFENSEGPDYGPLLAASMLATVPVAIVYFLAARRITHAFLQSGLR